MSACKIDNEVLLDSCDCTLNYVSLDSDILKKRPVLDTSDFTNHERWLRVCIMCGQLEFPLPRSLFHYNSEVDSLDLILEID